MDSLRELAENIGFSSNPRVYSDVILFSESHKVRIFRCILKSITQQFFTDEVLFDDICSFVRLIVLDYDWLLDVFDF